MPPQFSIGLPLPTNPAIHYLWRPFLPDPDDDMVLELAFASGSRYVITHNVKDFHGSEEFGVTALVPRDFLHGLRSTP